jgi:hypothetical protein
MHEEWTKTSQSLPNVRAGKFRVKRQNNIELDAFFYSDAMAWIAFYGEKTSYWWSAHGDNKRLDDVTHWKYAADRRPSRKCELI